MHVLPRDEKFFDLLIENARLALSASDLLANGVGARGEASRTAQQVRDFEHRGDEAFRSLRQKLHKTFITPLDGEDIHELGSLIDDILDHLEAVAYRFDAFGLETSPGQVPEISRMVRGCVESVVGALETLRTDGIEKPDNLARLCEEINTRELATEEKVRTAIRDLFATEQNPIELLKKKEVYELLEKTADRCEDLADVLEAVAVKNS